MSHVHTAALHAATVIVPLELTVIMGIATSQENVCAYLASRDATAHREESATSGATASTASTPLMHLPASRENLCRQFRVPQATAQRSARLPAARLEISQL
jgi:hypothetical protein